MTWSAEGWHPETDDDIDILRAELDACRAEITRLREQNRLLHRIFNDRGVESMGCGIFRVGPA